MTKKSVVFFGSFLHYSTKIAQKLLNSPHIDLVAVVTTPPAPAGKNNVLNYTHTHEWANQNNIPVFTPQDLYVTPPSIAFSSATSNAIKDDGNRFSEDHFDLSKAQAPLTSRQPTSSQIAQNDLKKNDAAIFPVSRPDFFLVAGYGKLLPQSWLDYPKIASLNLHFSLLPDYRGANPAEWAILMGETETGVTLIDMATEFDTGSIITRLNHPLSDEDTRESAYEALYDLAADIAVDTIPQLETTAFADPQTNSDKPYAYRFNRSHGFIDWQFIEAAINGHFPKNILPFLSKNLKTAWQFLSDHPTESDGLITPEVFLERAVRALSSFPGVWTYLPTKSGKKRLKILSTTLDEGILTLDQVQLEGQKPATFNQIKNQIID